jgi:tetratricopeptide (TPR) repeat protein
LKNLVLSFFCLVALKAGAQSSALAMADSLYTIGDYTKAINEYAKVDTPNAKLQIARTYNAIRNYDKAILQYEALIKQNSHDQIPKFELGKMYDKTKKAGKSKRIFEDLISENRNNPEYFYYLGKAFTDLDSISKSIVLYKKAIVVDSTHLRSIYQVAKYYVAEQERDSVVKYADLGLSFYENDVSIINLKALALYNNDEYKAAIPLFEKMVELGETTKFYIFERLANAYFKIENFDSAIKNYKRSLEIDEDNARALFSLGNTFWKQQQMDSAKVYIKKAIEVQHVVLDKEYQALGRIASEQKDSKIAIKYYKLAHEEDPSNVIYYYQICFIADQYYKDPKVKLSYYEQLITTYGGKNDYFTDFSRRRISELKKEIHFTAN